ncbi:hypothetical protein HanHA300_Chr16g0594491 [Helianthus annuus]|nr:hypothetical protein HanHA300_Chr16g0594491 [Helianthus annuus]KAJ0459075.1 hypothetical protein HanHA89_Chr16g0644801 [Helianthus annuus]KAJ0556390.1 hypothetical protein HanIR_Chr07g0313261 [Helianthus annuus]
MEYKPNIIISAIVLQKRCQSLEPNQGSTSGQHIWSALSMMNEFTKLFCMWDVDGCFNDLRVELELDLVLPAVLLMGSELGQLSQLNPVGQS